MSPTGRISTRSSTPTTSCKGDGIRWFRKFLGQDEKAPIRHPVVYSGFGARILGVNLPQKPARTAAILIPSVGCPVGCNFCSTSALFGGKGKFVNFYETGDELFYVMCQIEEKLRVQSFFVLDENFLLHRKRALRLLELMETAREELGLVRLQLRPRFAVLHDGAAGRAGDLLGLDGTGGGRAAPMPNSRTWTRTRW